MSAALVAGCGGGSSNPASPANGSAAAATSSGGGAPGAGSTATGAAFPLTLQRSDGKPLTLDAAPKRLVSLSPGATEIIYALGAEGELAAVDRDADYPPAAKAFPTRLDAFQPNVEAIAAIKPDLVFVASDSSGLVAALDRLGIPVLFSDLNSVKTFDDVLTQISLVGQATGKNAQAESLVSAMRAREKKVIDAIRDVPATQAPAVYHEVDNTYYTASDASFIGSLYKLLKAKNIAGDGGGSPYPQLTSEKIIAANPQVIVLADEAFGTTVDSVKARPGWQGIDAVKRSAIFAIDPSIVSRAGPRIIDALEQLAKDIYPQRFS
ncbi:MAG: ABC transporter substrate-binding protein [Dehalococcoidia bacterium]|nr:ABC transporter substrate-binding protein [Dehalococcoidia bacterium]